ncbi:MAG: hypothetical protein M3Z24_02355 [Chloroflexota bacterium]|nr:hypothetical protein [Chloroflexota bacterium]
MSYEAIHEKVRVVTVYDPYKGTVLPWLVKWQARIYTIEKIGYVHKVRVGRTLFHIFSVSNAAIAFRLKLDTDTLHWTLEEVSQV